MKNLILTFINSNVISKFIRPGFLFLVGLFFSSSAFAIQGALLPQDEIIPQACLIVYHTFNGDLKPCSGGIVDRQWILASSHCENNYARHKKVTISCAGGDQRTGVNIRFVHEKYLEIAKAIAMGEGDLTDAPMHDLALIKVDKPFTTTPIELVADEAQAARLLARPGQCRFYGAGYDNNNSRDELNGAILPPLTHGGDISRFIEVDGDSYLRSTDSGGPLVCTDKDNKNYFTGVNSRGPPIKALHLSQFVSIGHPLNLSWIRRIIRDN